MEEPEGRRFDVYLLAGTIAILLVLLVAGLVDAGPVGTDAAGSWTVHLREVDDALARGAVRAAEQAGTRVTSRPSGAGAGRACWRSATPISGSAPSRGPARRRRPRRGTPTSRRSSRARDEGSLEGVLRTAEAFARLGDREVADRCLRSAERLATARDAQARDQVRELASRLASGLQVEPRSADARSF